MPINGDIYDGPARNHSARDTTKLYIVVHSTQNDASAEDEASYAKRREDNVSSHYYVDSDEVVQSLDTDWRAWHVGSVEGNDHGISWEFVGFASWSRDEWLEAIDWKAAAAQIRRDCDHHGITPRDLSISQIRAGNKTGFVTHDEARQVWGGTTHTDPGPHFPMDHLVALVRGEDPGTSTTPGGSAKRPAPGPAVAFPLPGGHFFGPKSWGNESVSGHYGRSFRGRTDRDWLRVWVRQLVRRGWPAGTGQRYLTAHGSDGLWGDEHAELVRAFQRDQGLVVDGLLGPRTWNAAFVNPVT